jgi:hypothetical protein
MHRVLIALLLILGTAKADLLFRDGGHRDRAFRFESNARDVQATVRQKAVVERADTWAREFCGDQLLQAIDVEFKRSPLRYWLVTFSEPLTGEKFYSVVLPDGTIVEPVRQERI